MGDAGRQQHASFHDEVGGGTVQRIAHSMQTFQTGERILHL